MPDLQQLEALYEAHASALYGFLLSLTRSEADTRDLLQDIFVRLAERPAILKGVANPRHFLLKLGHNLAIDQGRRRSARERRHEQYAADTLELFETSHEDPDQQCLNRELTAALGELPTEQRAVVQLKLWEGLTFESIAEVLAISPNTAASRYRYGLDKLRERLRPFYEEIQSS